jgi:hypothetical protein
VQINTSEKVFDSSGHCLSGTIEAQLLLMTRQILQFASRRESRSH